MGELPDIGEEHVEEALVFAAPCQVDQEGVVDFLNHCTVSIGIGIGIGIGFSISFINDCSSHDQAGLKFDLKRQPAEIFIKSVSKLN